jgi:hypothetical protein
MTAISLLLTFFFMVGMGLLALCGLFDNRVEGPLNKIRPFARFTISSYSAMLVVIGLFLWLIFGFPDQMNPTDPPPTLTHETLRYVCTVAAWPFAITSLILHGDPPLAIDWLLLWITTGLFWGFIIELFFILNARKRHKTSRHPS